MSESDGALAAKLHEKTKHHHAVLRLTLAEFNALEAEVGEYSCSMPTGVVPGKRWLRCEPYTASRDPLAIENRGEWLLMWYGPAFRNDRGEEVCAILYRKVEVTP